MLQRFRLFLCVAFKKNMITFSRVFLMLYQDYKCIFLELVLPCKEVVFTFGSSLKLRKNGSGNKTILKTLHDIVDIEITKKIIFASEEIFAWIQWTLATRACFIKVSDKRPVIWLYWFTAQHQTSAFTRQKHDSFYSKFDAQFNEFVSSACKQQGLP